MPIICAIGEAMAELQRRDGNELRLGFAGDVFNTLAYLRAVGGAAWDCRFVSALGDDPLSTEFIARSEVLGVRPVCARLPGKAIGLYLIHTGADGERSFSYWRSDSAARSTLSALDASQRDALECSELVLFSGITLAILDDAQRRQLLQEMQRLRGMGKRIVFDPNYRARLWPDTDTAQRWIQASYEIASTVLPGLDDERALSGAADAVALREERVFGNADEIVVKAGTDGIFGRADGRDFHLPFEPVGQVIDTTAAGDSFTAGWLAARHAGLDGESSAQVAARVAGFVVTRPGAIVDFGTEDPGSFLRGVARRD